MSSWIRVSANKKRVIPTPPPIYVSNDVGLAITQLVPTSKNQRKFSNELIDKDVYELINKCNNTDNRKSEIPKIAFSFWEGSEFSYLHLLTIQSFAFYNPDFRIIIYSTETHDEPNRTWDTPEHNKKVSNNLCNLDELRLIPNVELVTVNLKSYFPNIDNISCVYKSDIIRVIKLHEHGGIWIDFDILFNKRIPNSLLQLEKNSIGIFKYDECIAIGFIFSHKNNPILEYLILQIRNILQENNFTWHYQYFGTKMWTKLLSLPIVNNYIKLLSNKICYPYIWNELGILYKSNNDQLTHESVGIYWYNGADISKTYINNSNFNSINPHKSVMDKYVYKVINEIGSEFKGKNN